MRSHLALAAAALVLSVSGVGAQSPVQAVFAACPAPARVFSEAQVQTAARFVSDSSVSPRPSVRTTARGNLVEFVVDTLGVPDPRTLATRNVVDSLLIQRVAQTMSRWRYSPAIASGCKVPQRVTATVGW